MTVSCVNEITNSKDSIAKMNLFNIYGLIGVMIITIACGMNAYVVFTTEYRRTGYIVSFFFQALGLEFLWMIIYELYYYSLTNFSRLCKLDRYCDVCHLIALIMQLFTLYKHSTDYVSYDKWAINMMYAFGVILTSVWRYVVIDNDITNLKNDDYVRITDNEPNSAC